MTAIKIFVVWISTLIGATSVVSLSHMRANSLCDLKILVELSSLFT